MTSKRHTKKGSEFTGVMTALVTPVDTSTQVVDAKGMAALVDEQIGAGVDSLLVLGGTGEFTALSRAQRVEAARAAVDAASGRVPVVGGVLSPGLHDAVESALELQKAGCSAAMVVTPYYAAPSQAGIVDYYRRLAEMLKGFPVLLYNIPGKTVVNLEVSSAVALLDGVPNIVGIKECAPDLGQFIDLVNALGNSCAILSGDELLAPSSVASGGHGIVMASANLIPRVWVDIFSALSDTDLTRGFSLFAKHRDLIKLLFSEGNPGPLKWTMAQHGMPCGPSLAPLGTPTATLQEALIRELSNLRMDTTHRLG